MIGKPIFELDRVDSTNAYANQVMAKGNLTEGTVIWAHEQYAGRGQLNHHWISEAGQNLTFTVVLKPSFLSPDRQFLLNKAVSLGAIDFVRNSLKNLSGNQIHETGIKWPNDIYIGNQKIGGILIEHKIMGNALETSLAGIGMNINQIRFSSEIPNPVSLIQLLHSEMALKEALVAICSCLGCRYKMLQDKETETLDHDYHNALLGFNQWRFFTRNGNLMEGKITGVDNLGRLLIETRQGEVVSFNHREVEYVLGD